MKQPTLPLALLTDLHEVDRVVLERANSRSVVLRTAGQYLLRSGGKRIRAILTLLAAQLGVYRLEDVLHAATAVELIHAASLVHDDLVDESDQRRGVQTVHTRWNSGVALMVGDYLFALAAGEMALAPDPRVITYFSHAVMTICEGELTPVMGVTPLETALDQYYYKIGCKTAALFAAACKAGMASGCGSGEQIEALGRFGYDLGLAFQIVDDILDFTGSELTLGKPAGNDFRHGTITIPLIYAVAFGGGSTLASSMDSKEEEVINWAIQEVLRLGVKPAQTAAQHHINQALSHLDIFPDTPTRQILGDIAAFVLERNR